MPHIAHERRNKAARTKQDLSGNEKRQYRRQRVKDIGQVWLLNSHQTPLAFRAYNVSIQCSTIRKLASLGCLRVSGYDRDSGLTVAAQKRRKENTKSRISG